MSRHPFVVKRIPGHGIELSARRGGSGRHCVILLHGFPENSSTWANQFDPLVDAGLTVIAPDLRGYGGSDRPRGTSAYGINRLIADVAAIIHAEGGRASIVGHDWGGLVAWATAAQHPELIEKLVILNAPHPRIFARHVRRPPQIFRSWYILPAMIPVLSERILAAGDFRLIRQMFRRMPSRPGAFSEDRIDEMIDGLRPRGALTAALNYYRANVGSKALMGENGQRITVPTLVLWGDRDPALGVELLDGLDRYVNDLRIRRFPDVGHWIQNEAPGEVSAALVEFLTGNGLREENEPGVTA